MKTETSACPQVMIISSVHRWNDTRILYREARTLSDKYCVEINAVAPFKQHKWEDIQIRGLRRLPRWARPINWITLGWRALRSPARVIHFHDPELMPIGLLLRLCGKEVIYDVHEDVSLDLMEKSWIPFLLRRPAVWIYRFFQALADRFLSAIVTATEPIATQFHHPRLTVVRNYPPADFFTETGSRPTYRVGSQLNLIYVGSITESRGVLEIIMACKYLPESWDYRLTILGGAEMDSAYGLQLSAAARPFNGRIEFQGHLDFKQAISALQTAHIGLVCTQPTPNDVVGLPLKLFEYMVAGLAVVMSDFPAWREYVTDYPLHESVNPTDPAAIAGGIRALVRRLQAVDSKQVREDAREALNKYNWSSQAKSLLALYQGILPVGISI